jgi:NADH-quinone oxidoreductase subunit M
MFQKLMFGPLDNERNRSLPDLSSRERCVFVPLCVMIFVMGVAPRPFLRAMKPSVDRFVAAYHEKLAQPDGPAHVFASALAPPDHADPAGYVGHDDPGGAP